MKQNQTDLILSEINMLDDEWSQLIRSIRGLRRTGRNTPAIAMIPAGSLILRDRALAAGFNTYLDKPFTPKKLLEAIQAALRSFGERLS